VNTVLELKNVTKIYKMDSVEVPALRNVSLKIKRGDFISIVGPSGSGKSTMLNMMGCLDRPTRGRVFLDGKDTSHFNDDELAHIRGKKIGFVFQMFNLVGRLTALENVMLPLWFRGAPSDVQYKIANKLLDEVGLSKRKHHLPNQLSGGERQRVAIARALANDPEIILADEPTGNLDTKSGNEILNLLSTLNKKKGKTIIIVTHDLRIANKSKRKIEMIDGQIKKRR